MPSDTFIRNYKLFSYQGQLHKDKIVTKPFHTESDEMVLRFARARARREELERLLKDGRLEDGVEMLLEKMLRFLAEMPVDRYHDYREFRHKGLRSYLIHQFLTEKWRARACKGSLLPSQRISTHFHFSLSTMFPSMTDL